MEFNLRGKYGEAKVFTDIIDDRTVGQITGILNTPLSENAHVRIMPDCHAGKGCVVGTTMHVSNKVCPNIVGVDIGCGMLVVELGKIDLDLKIFDEIVHKIPSGHESYEEPSYDEYSGKRISTSELQWYGSGLIHCNENHPGNWFKKLKCFNELDQIPRLIGNLGSLGGGNHFIEVDVDDDGNKYLVIHSGSRNLGKQVAEHYQRIAKKQYVSKRRNEVIRMAKAEGKEKDLQEILKTFKLPVWDETLFYLEDEDMQNYLHDLKLCQEFALWNRRMMALTIIERYFIETIGAHEDVFGRYKDDKMIFVSKTINVGKTAKSVWTYNFFETIHNYINFDDMILRKGSVSAKEGERLIIPMNMRDGSLICIGKGNEDWNMSAPHGAGRILSRGEAKDKVSLEEYKEAMKGIYTTTVSQSTIDESPMAYKPMDSIVENIKDTVSIEKIIKPIYNFKASTEEPIWLKEKE